MKSTNSLTTYVQRVIDALVAQGVTRIVISPGSRSTPVALLLAHNAARYHLKLFVDVDERSAAFFALGMAKVSHQPVLLVCTSGTAAANYYPAVIEAQLTHQPLIVLTTDRPPELTNIGAPQAIDQDHLYGQYVKQFAQLPLPSADATTLDYVAFNVQRLVLASETTPLGPVHLNLPLRKPLMPDLELVAGPPVVRKITKPMGDRQLSPTQLTQLVGQLSGRRGLFIAGPQETADDWSGLVQLAEAVGWPILADPLSGLRQTDSSLVISGYEQLFAPPITLAAAQPELVIRIGATPVSAHLAGWLKAFDGPVTLVDAAATLADHTLATTAVIRTTVATLVTQLTGRLAGAPAVYTQAWQTLEQVYRQQVKLAFQTDQLTEGQVAYTVATQVPSANVFVSNSMPIRDVDQFGIPQTHSLNWWCNRGANGIDGVVSSALGMAAVSDRANYLVIGDLAFFHDMNGLMMAQRHQLALTIIVINNNGGGIFSFLPQAAAESYFEPLFGTPQNLKVAAVAQLYEATYELVASTADLQGALQQSTTGLRLIEVRTDRNENVVAHRKLASALKAEMEAHLEN